MIPPLVTLLLMLMLVESLQLHKLHLQLELLELLRLCLLLVIVMVVVVVVVVMLVVAMLVFVSTLAAATGVPGLLLLEPRIRLLHAIVHIVAGKALLDHRRTHGCFLRVWWTSISVEAGATLRLGSTRRESATS